MPGTMNAATAMAMDVRSQLRKKRMGGLSGRFGAARRGSLVDSARRAGGMMGQIGACAGSATSFILPIPRMGHQA